MTEFKVGDKVITPDAGVFRFNGVKKAIPTAAYGTICALGSIPLVKFIGWTGGHEGLGFHLGGGAIGGVGGRNSGNKLFIGSTHLKPYVEPVVVRAPTLTPTDQLILKHLQKRGSISPVEAFAAYGRQIIATSIHRLRNMGHIIETELMRDEAGHRYARYTYSAY